MHPATSLQPLQLGAWFSSHGDIVPEAKGKNKEGKSASGLHPKMDLVEHWGSPLSVIARGTKTFPFLRWRGWVWGKREKKEDETRAHAETFQNVLKDAEKWRVHFFVDHVNIIFNLTSFIMTPLEGWNMHSYQLLLFNLKHACWVVVGFYTREIKRSRMLGENIFLKHYLLKCLQRISRPSQRDESETAHSLTFQPFLGSQ